MIPHVLAFVLLFSAAGTSAQTLSDSEKVALVFPFKVGQQYEFMSSGAYIVPAFGNTWPPNTWPPYTVATITITDTVVNGTTYLHIPFWSPFGSDYYRLDDSLRVWMGFSYVGIAWYERKLLDLNLEWFDRYSGYDTFAFAYLEAAYHPDDYFNYRPSATCGWTTLGTTPVYDMMFYPESYTSDLVIDAFHGAYGPGSCLHATGHCQLVALPGGAYICAYKLDGLWGLFRPKSSDPWPQFSEVVKVRVEKHPCCEGRMHAAVVGYPNPFNATTTLRYRVAETGLVTLCVYNLSGQCVRTLVEGRIPAGTHTVVWDGRDSAGRLVASGVYLSRLRAGEESVVARLVLVR